MLGIVDWKSLSVIDFIGWAVGHDPELRVIYSSFSDRLGVRANLRVQRSLDSKTTGQNSINSPGTRCLNYQVIAYLRQYRDARGTRERDTSRRPMAR